MQKVLNVDFIGLNIYSFLSGCLVKLILFLKSRAKLVRGVNR